MQQTTELTNFTICTPPDIFVSESTKIGVFGFGPDDFYKFLNSVSLTEQMVIYTIPNANDVPENFTWIKKVVAEADCVFINNESKRMVISKSDNYKNVYMIDNTFDTINEIVRLHGKEN